MKEDKGCMGVECPVKTQCKRYTKMRFGDVMRKCRGAKMFLQDEEKVNVDCLRK